MAITAKGTLNELNGLLDSCSLSSNSDIEQIVAGGKPDSRMSVQPRIEKAVGLVGKLTKKGKDAEVRALLQKWRDEPAQPTIIGTIPNLNTELDIMGKMVEDIQGGGALDPSLEHGSEAEQIRFYTVREAIEKRRRFHLVLDEVARRAGL